MNGELKLTAKQQLFVHEYLIDKNATQSAIRAGYSTRTARAIGCENLTKPNVMQAINLLMEESIKETYITKEKKRQALWSVVENVLDNKDVEYTVQSMVAAIKELNEMDGDHSNKKIEISVVEGMADYLQAAINERRNQSKPLH